MKPFAVHIFTAIVMLFAVSCANADTKPLTTQLLTPSSWTTKDIAKLQGELKLTPVGKRIAFWADAFVGTPYDTDPLGVYVSCKKVVCDIEVDCMYLAFRSAELATSETPLAAEVRALDLRFRTKGRVENGIVMNYEDRFEYGEDMVTSGKWGEDVSAKVGKTEKVAGSRGRDYYDYVPKAVMLKPEALKNLQDGDIIYFVKDPSRRAVGEVVGHLGVIKVENGKPMLIHASGSKKGKDRPGGGVVKKVDLLGYLTNMKFIGVIIARFS